MNYLLLYSDTDRVKQWANHHPASGESDQTGAEQREPERGGLQVSDQGSGRGAAGGTATDGPHRGAGGEGTTKGKAILHYA